MRVSTMTNLFYHNRPDGRGYLESVIRTNEAGFQVMDFCMCPMQRGETELNGDNWQELTYAVANEAAKRGVEFSQSHLPYPKAVSRRKTAFDEGCEKNEWFIRTTERCIEISAMLGVKWAVVHPVMYEMNNCADPDRDVAYNHEIYDRYFELASKKGVGLAFENMADLDGKRRFGALPGELLAINESYGNDRYVGICWDFGHANRIVKNQEELLRKVLPRLRATHVDDNIGTEDLHMIPFLGTVNWKKLMPILREGGYSGDFNFEIKYAQCFPEHLQDEAAAFAYQVGEYLVSLAKSE